MNVVSVFFSCRLCFSLFFCTFTSFPILLIKSINKSFSDFFEKNVIKSI